MDKTWLDIEAVNIKREAVRSWKRETAGRGLSHPDGSNTEPPFNSEALPFQAWVEECEGSELRE